MQLIDPLHHIKTLKGNSKHFYFTEEHNKKWLNTELYIVHKNLKSCVSNSLKIPNVAHFIVTLELLLNPFPCIFLFPKWYYLYSELNSDQE